jgi:hypothetical protein
VNTPPAQSDLDFWTNCLGMLDDQMSETSLENL